MKKFIVNNSQSIYDICNQEYHSIEHLFLLLTDNDLSPNSELTVNQELIKSDESIYDTKNNIVNLNSKEKQVKYLNANFNQNLYDLILNEYGTIESMFLLLTDNDLSPNSEINANQELIVSIDNLNKGNKDIKNFIIKNNIIYTNNSNALATSGDYNNDYNNDYYK